MQRASYWPPMRKNSGLSTWASLTPHWQCDSRPRGILYFGEVKVSQSCPTLCNPMDYTVHEILQARVVEWVAFPFSRGSSQPRDWTQVSHTAGRFFTSWATREGLYFGKNGKKFQSQPLSVRMGVRPWFFLWCLLDKSDYCLQFFCLSRLPFFWTFD